MVGVKLWSSEDRILFSNDPALKGLIFSGSPQKAAAWRGGLTWRVTPLDDAEHSTLKTRWSRLLEIFCPIRDGATGRVVAVAEFYHSLDDLEATLGAKRLRMWLLLAAIGLPMYALLAIAVRRTSRTIWQQERELHRRVDELSQLLAQNRKLHRQVRMAAAHGTALNERFRQRTSSELHDGPVQDLSYALLQVDRLEAAHVRCSVARTADCCELEERLEDIRSALRLSVDELRRVAADFAGVDLVEVSPGAGINKAVERHMNRTKTPVRLDLSEMPEQAPLSTKITLYRAVQESLQNAFRHAGGNGQRVTAWSDQSSIWVEISDRGPGFDVDEAMARDDCLGLTGLRDRVSILGGRFKVESTPASGTRVSVCLPLVPGTECPHV
jgi:signal transduction histidine kinase